MAKIAFGLTSYEIREERARTGYGLEECRLKMERARALTATREATSIEELRPVIEWLVERV